MLKTRCPACSKLYAVDRGDIAGQSTPQFECSACRTRFAMPLPEVIDETASPVELKSVAVTWQSMPEIVDSPNEKQNRQNEVDPKIFRRSENQLDVVEETEPCPKCSFENPLRVKECQKCGVIFSRFNPRGENKFRLKPEVSIAWELALADYTNIEKHQEFAQICFENSCLPYAAFKYQSILDADPGEDVAEKMQDYVIALATASVDSARNFKLDLSKTKLNKLLRPLFIIIGFVFAMGHFMTGLTELRMMGAAFLVAGVFLYAANLWKSYNIKIRL